VQAAVIEYQKKGLHLPPFEGTVAVDTTEWKETLPIVPGIEWINVT
jgi:hypothetical protein